MNLQLQLNRNSPAPNHPTPAPNPHNPPDPRDPTHLPPGGLPRTMEGKAGPMQISGSSNTTTSAQAVHDAFQRNAERAERLADAENNPQLEKDLAELPSDAQNVAIQTKAIKARDEMLGDLLDVLA